ncbi:unnamed protein product [Protopolystoma xenopodis]|uniref:Uncharacterized protein n=1 Tax=Protopolystoma xenopodis TaxID=117903 RepID=A0A3S5ACP2_9PLAT|nr:unnamed protein product [Protopolystoma xenopodis]
MAAASAEDDLNAPGTVEQIAGNAAHPATWRSTTPG